MPSRSAPDAERWLPLGEASQVVGVDPDTLRRWADEGLVDVFVTPGGHRRFDRRSLDRVRRSGAPRVSADGLGVTPARLVATYRRVYERRARGRAGSGALMDVVGPDAVERDAFREAGRSLVEALVQYLDGRDDQSRETAYEHASALAREHGRRLAERGVGLPQAIRVFVAARRPFVAEIGALARRRSLDPQRLTRLFEEATDLLDHLLLEFVQAAASSERSPQ